MESTTAVTDLISQLRNERYLEARTKIWQRYGEALIRRASLVLRNLPDTYGNAEEAAASAFMRFTEKAQAGELTLWPTNRESLQELLLRAARDRARDIKRKSLLSRDREGGLESLDFVPNRSEANDDIVVQEAIEYMREHLPVKTFQAAMLRTLEMPYREIAEIQKTGEKTVERRIAAARKCLTHYRQDKCHGD